MKLFSISFRLRNVLFSDGTSSRYLDKWIDNVHNFITNCHFAKWIRNTQRINLIRPINELSEKRQLFDAGDDYDVRKYIYLSNCIIVHSVILRILRIDRLRNWSDDGLTTFINGIWLLKCQISISFNGTDDKIVFKISVNFRIKSALIHLFITIGDGRLGMANERIQQWDRNRNFDFQKAVHNLTGPIHSLPSDVIWKILAVFHQVIIKFIESWALCPIDRMSEELYLYSDEVHEINKSLHNQLKFTFLDTFRW